MLGGNSVHSSINSGIGNFRFFRSSHCEVMQRTKLSILVSVVVARLCRAEVVIASLTSDRATSHIVEDLVTIVASCYGDQIRGVAVGGNLPDTLLRTLSTQHSIPVSVIGSGYQRVNDFRQLISGNSRVKLRQKLQIFIVKASSYRRFLYTLQNIKYSKWWNHMGSFLIVDSSRGCNMNVQFLKTAWRFGILNANVMCYNDRVEGMVVNYNPFTSYAPVPWEKLGTVKGQNKHPFTLFVRKLQGNGTICSNLDFDKVKDCGNYGLRVHGVDPEEFEPDKTRRYADAVDLINHRVLFTMFRALHVIPTYTLRDVDIDIYKEPRAIDYSWYYTIVTYPHDQMGSVLLSQFRGNKSQLSKVLGVIDMYSYIGLCVAYLVTLMFFKFVIRQALMPAILNLIRITCNAGFENIPRSSPPRIYVAGVLFLAVTMHGIFEGNLASLLTTVIPLRNVKTFKDVLDFNYTLYGYDARLWNLEPEIVKRSIKLSRQYMCTNKVRQDKSSACLCSSDAATLDDALMFNLHVSPKTETNYVCYGIKWDWPYEERFNALISRLVEADVLKPWDVKCDPVNLEDFSVDKDVKKNVAVKVLEFHELTFAFVILGIGLALAVIAFILELGMHYVCRPICRCICRPICRRICKVGIAKRDVRN